MGARKQKIHLAQWIDIHTTKLTSMKGEIDGIMRNMPKTHPQYDAFTWIRGMVSQMLAMSNAIKADYISTTTRLEYIETAMRAILGSSWDTPPQELLERAQLLGSFYKDLSKHKRGET
jgi:hypothetical protein